MIVLCLLCTRWTEICANACFPTAQVSGTVKAVRVEPARSNVAEQICGGSDRHGARSYESSSGRGCEGARLAEKES
jgi:hypothetical protein